MINSEKDLEYFDEKIEQIYNLIKRLEVNINGGSFLINDEKFIKQRLAEMGAVGYERYKINFIKHQTLSNKHKMQPVIQFSLSGEYLDWHPSIRAAARAVGVDKSAISSAIKRAKYNKSKTGGILGKSGGCRWILEKDYKNK